MKNRLINRRGRTNVQGEDGAIKDKILQATRGRRVK